MKRVCKSFYDLSAKHELRSVKWAVPNTNYEDWFPEYEDELRHAMRSNAGLRRSLSHPAHKQFVRSVHVHPIPMLDPRPESYIAQEGILEQFIGLISEAHNITHVWY